MKFLLAIVCTLLPGEWPQFRGPNSDGHSAEPMTPMEWSDTQNVAWKIPVPGLGWSSPVVANGTVFLTTAVPRGEGLSLRVLAINAKNGETIWDREIRTVDSTPAIHKKNSHASPTPIVHEGSVFVHFGALGMACLSAADGTIVWTNAELEYSPVHGSGGSPVLSDGKLFIACDGNAAPFVAAVDAANGGIAWKTPRSVDAKINHSFVTAAVTVVEGQTQVLAPGPDHLAAYSLDTGEELWKVRAPGWSVVPQPAIGHGMVFYNHDYDNPELMAVRLNGKGDVTDSHVMWRISRGAPSTPSPLLVGDELFIVSDIGIASCVDARTGENHWTERLGGNFSASPIYANGRVLFLNETGVATWIQQGTEFQKLGTNEIPGRTFATPAFADGAMYLRTDESLYRFSE